MVNAERGTGAYRVAARASAAVLVLLAWAGCGRDSLPSAVLSSPDAGVQPVPRAAPRPSPPPVPCAVRGRVEAPGSAPELDLRYEAGEVRGKLKPDGEGRFEQEVPCGVVRLLGRVQSTKQVLWEGVAPADDLVLQLPKHQALGRLEVHVLGERGPVRGAEVYAGPMGPRRECGDPPGPPLPRPLRKEPWSLSGLTDAGGVAVLPGLAPGLYKLEVTAKGYAPFTPYGVEVVGDVTRAEVRLVRGVQVEGRLLDERGRGIPGVFVNAVPEDEAGKSVGEPAVVESGPSGALRFVHLPPAPSYRLEAHPGDSWLSLGPVVVPARGPAVLRLRRPPVISGRVLGWDGQPPESFEVDGMEFDDTSGRFRMLLSSPGGVDVRAPGHLPLHVKVPEGGGNLGTLRLERVPLAHWRVVDESGRAVAGATVEAGGCEGEAISDADGGFSLDAQCRDVQVQKGELRGSWKRGEGDDARILTVRPLSRVRVQVFGPDGKPDTQAARELRCDSRWEDVPRVLVFDGRGAADLALPRGRCSLGGPGLTVHFAVSQPNQELVLGHSPGTFAVTVELPQWARRVRLTTVPPSERAWESAAEQGTVIVPGLPAGKYSARWMGHPRSRRPMEAEFDVPAREPVRPPVP